MLLILAAFISSVNCAYAWTGSGPKGYPHVQGDPNLAIGSYWCDASFIGFRFGIFGDPREAAEEKTENF
jgi:hypothetical protein